MSKEASENTERVSYRLSPANLSALKREAKRRGLDVADVLREMTRDWVKRQSTRDLQSNAG